MALLSPLQQFEQMFKQMMNNLKYYNENLRNENFKQNCSESDEQAIKRGEIIFDQSDEILSNLNNILDQEEEILQFFRMCKENKQKIIENNNQIIDSENNCQDCSPNTIKYNETICKNCSYFINNCDECSYDFTNNIPICSKCQSSYILQDNKCKECLNDQYYLNGKCKENMEGCIKQINETVAP